MKLFYHFQIPKCCKSGQLRADICSGCPICAAGIDEECGAGVEGFQPVCANQLTCFTRCGKLNNGHIPFS